MKSVFISDRAARSLDRIASFSKDAFGSIRGDRYIADLLRRCRTVADGKAQHQSCRRHFAEDLREDLRFTRSGRHYIIFIDTPTETLIVDFIHQSADIGRRLTKEPE
jgi:toxin ParE1/3/4